MANYVECSLCKGRCSRDVVGGIEVTNCLVKCGDCIMREAREDRDWAIGHRIEMKGRVWNWVRIVVAGGILVFLGWVAAHAKWKH